MVEYQRAFLPGSSPSPTRADRDPVAALLRELGGGWYRTGTLVGPAAKFAPPAFLIHPELGVAVVERTPLLAEQAADRLREALDRARFRQVRGGLPPIVTAAISSGRPAEQAARELRDALSAAPTLSLGFLEGWDRSVCRLLASAHPSMPDWQPESAPRRLSRRSTSARGRWRLAGVIAITALSAFALANLAIQFAPDAADRAGIGAPPAFENPLPRLGLTLADEAALTASAADHADDVVPLDTPGIAAADVASPDLPTLPEKAAAAQQTGGPPDEPLDGVGATIGPVLSSPPVPPVPPTLRDARTDPARSHEGFGQARVALAPPRSQAPAGDPRCRAIVTKVQLGGALTDDERAYMRSGCAQGN